jgi:hypothetical protein
MYLNKCIKDWLTLNFTKHCLGQLAQLLEVTHLCSKKYPAELTPLNIFSQTEFMMRGTTYLALWLTLTLSLYLKKTIRLCKSFRLFALWLLCARLTLNCVCLLFCVNFSCTAHCTEAMLVTRRVLLPSINVHVHVHKIDEFDASFSMKHESRFAQLKTMTKL